MYCLLVDSDYQLDLHSCQYLNANNYHYLAVCFLFVFKSISYRYLFSLRRIVICFKGIILPAKSISSGRLLRLKV